MPDIAGRPASLRGVLTFREHGRPTASDAAPVRKRRRARGFSLIEVAAAATVLTLGVSTSLLTLQRGLQSVSHARNLTHASNVMQTELEGLRLKNWAQVEALQAGGDAVITSAPIQGAPPITCVRVIRDIRPGMKEITIDASWGGSDGRAHTARMITRYSRSGLNDYFYTSQ